MRHIAKSVVVVFVVAVLVVVCGCAPAGGGAQGGEERASDVYMKAPGAEVVVGGDVVGYTDRNDDFSDGHMIRAHVPEGETYRYRVHEGDVVGMAESYTVAVDFKLGTSEVEVEHDEQGKLLLSFDAKPGATVWFVGYTEYSDLGSTGTEVAGVCAGGRVRLGVADGHIVCEGVNDVQQKENSIGVDVPLYAPSAVEVSSSADSPSSDSSPAVEVPSSEQ